MAKQQFSTNEAINFGWKTMKDNIGFFIGFLVVAGLLYAIPAAAQEFFKNRSPVLYSVTIPITQVISTILGMGLLRISLRYCDNEKGKFSDLFSRVHLFFKYVTGSILYFLIVCGGLLLLVVPGIVWSFKYLFVSYLIIDRGVGPVEALRKSAELTKGVKWELATLYGLLILINLLGALCFGIGLFATIPTSMIAMAFVYRKLLDQAETVKIPGKPDVSGAPEEPEVPKTDEVKEVPPEEI